MRVFVAPAVLVLSLAVAVAQEKKDDAAADLKAMVGKWKLEKAELGGKDALGLLKDLKFEITGPGKYLAQLGEQKDEGTFTVDPSKSPKEMDIKGTGGPNKDKTIPAIYKLDGDTLTIAYELGGGKRPERFESKPDTKQYLAVYKREKK
jgi:uncharacterized protein (TIGR03067 family)